jgi:bile acid:Na+ symporter, BASS family
MQLAGGIPQELLAIAAAATVFTVMLSLGCHLEIREFRGIWRQADLLARGLFAVLLAVPALAFVVTHALGLPRAADVGIMLMAVSPGAPVALKRSLDAGGHPAFAPALQILIAIAAVVSMPLSIFAFDMVYAGQVSIEPWPVAKQVFIAQLLPLGLGMAFRRFLPAHATRVEPALARIAKWLLMVLTVLAIFSAWQFVVGAGLRLIVAIILVTVLALTAGHLLGGPSESTRTAVAISSAARNPGLALLVVALNHVPAALNATVLIYLVVAAFTIVPYVMWRRQRGTGRAV